jgi:hypothetical protein
MRLIKATVIALTAIFAAGTASAAPIASKPTATSEILLVGGKKADAKKAAKPAKKAAPKKAAPKKAAKKGPGKCGTFNYWDKKKKACVDQRNKR